MWDKQKRIDEVYKWADRKRKDCDAEYQKTGKETVLKAYQTYDDVCQICEWAKRAIKDPDKERAQRLKEQRDIISQMLQLKADDSVKTFTFIEVEEWMRKMMV